ncbi:tetratricopeptide repeat protein [Pseudohalioglobus sediminis]|uniref:Tetratricopeptide repeat protein n=1 Tax=Pseudohalioglobus sediminis TaxID=2606449 RepID=A0A5B0WS23_9GAMM|nr:tetratricopeptide repeat-containing sulfotransferase family protein [Pseudohalioglobus sediminis]KAA1189135.1 tetratricopeptide repeat protein [Pseudohalioglobus sediminis]
MTSPEKIMRYLEQGYQLQQQGRYGEAEAGYREVLKLDPRNVHALNLLGILAINSDRPLEAIELITQALAENPDDPQAHGNLGLAYKDAGQFEAAVAHFKQSLQLNPKNLVMMNNLGNALRESGNARDAITCFEAALRLDRAYAACWSNLAAAQRDMEDYGKAMKALDRALELDPEQVAAHHLRASVFVKLARFEDALACFERVLELEPGRTDVMIEKSDALRDLNRADEARQTLDTVLQREPGNPFAWHALGVLHEQLGDRDRAAECFQRCLQLAPDYASAHYQLAQLKGRQTPEQELQQMELLWRADGMLDEDRKLLAFALFRAWDQRDEVAKAWHYLAQGNRIKAEASPYDRAFTHSLTDGIITAARALQARPPGQARAPASPGIAFVMGMPRSGTTLTEQVLSAHSCIMGAGEVSYAFDCARLASHLTNQPFPQCVAELTDAHLEEIGRYYRSRHREVDQGTAWIVDKTPLNFQYLGLMARALPEAKFIHCRREPVDNCFSIHRIPFDEKQTYAHGLESLADYYQQYRRMMDAWHALYPERILDVDYEATVADLRAQCERMLGFLELEFQPAMLEFHSGGGLVKTPSASQVREPIYRDAVAAWKRYEEFLQPLVAALGHD